MQLEKRLQDQVSVRRALENALGYKSSSYNIVNDVSIPKVGRSVHVPENV